MSVMERTEERNIFPQAVPRVMLSAERVGNSGRRSASGGAPGRAALSWRRRHASLRHSSHGDATQQSPQALSQARWRSQEAASPPPPPLLLLLLLLGAVRLLPL